MPFWSTIPGTFSSLPTFSDPAYVLKAGDIVFHVTAAKNDAIKIGTYLTHCPKKNDINCSYQQPSAACFQVT